nr:cysteine peptidase family C39 domain-containing protein [uncultured Ruminococcus sp.]
MSKRKILIIVSCIYLAIAAIGILPAIYTTRETVTDTDVSKEYFIDAADNPIEKQEDGQCSAYAAAYVMRYCGDDTHGSELYPDVDRILGAALPSNVVQLFRDHGYQAKAYHGTLDTLKKRLSEGTPVIVYLRIPNDTHYAVVTGYDEEHLYLADPMTENANADNKNYNRIIENEEFLAIWKSGFPISDNVYIVATKSAEP